VPGDYAWGSGGLDAIISQLLNQLDGSGAPPAARETIEQLPKVKVTKEQVSGGVGSWFSVGVPVRQTMLRNNITK
jgi:E3 ubiquitin-protein ligase RNF115/126